MVRQRRVLPLRWFPLLVPLVTRLRTTRLGDFALGILAARLLSLPAIVLLGEASYAFYLIHDPAISWFGAGHWVEDASAWRFVFEAMILGLILALAVGLHVTVELPARRFLRRFLSLKPGAPLRSAQDRLRSTH
jgi:peptidoglycan/LPS O-acetylase OafA/YrhL